MALTSNVSLSATFGVHTYGDWITDKAATCTASGTKHRDCTHTGCDARENGTIPALGHDFSSETATATYLKSAATCTADAVYYHKCSRCTAKGTTTWTKTGTKLGHGQTNGYTPIYSWSNDINVHTCSFTLKCLDCNTNVVSNQSLTGTQTAHTNATCTAEGSSTYKVTGTYNVTGSKSYSGFDTKTYTIPALGHDMTEHAHVPATCTETGMDAYWTCSRCEGKLFKDENGSAEWSGMPVLAALGHDINDNQCSRCDLKAKAVYADGTLTFYFDDVEHSGTAYSLNAAGKKPEWYTQSRSAITDVVFDASFAAALPTSCNNWFAGLRDLRSITGIEYLNTQEVTDMMFMFEFCSSLQSLNLRNFHTEKVTSMCSMFYGCESLTSLDLNSFNTENVEDMEYLFCQCRNLQELTIGNNFTIKQNTNTEGMWWFCNALNTLNLKSLPFLQDGTFNTQFSGDGKTVNVILDDNSEIYTDGTNYLPAATSATFNREIVADGGMYSFFVPFDIPAGQAAELGKFYQYTSHNPEVRKVYFDDIAEVSDGVVKANTAYFFKPAKDITSFTVNNPSIPRTLTIRDPENPSVPGLYGTYSEIEIPIGAYGYVVQDGQSTFVKAGYGNVLRPYRAYLWLGSGAYMAKALAFFGDYDDITGINNIETDTDLDMSKPIYTLSGQRIMTPKKGEIYIQNGKKVIKK